MTKFTLLTAASVAAMALAGAASAQEFSGTVGTTPVNVGTIAAPTPYRLANEAIATTAAPIVGATTAVYTPAAGTIGLAQTYLLTFDLTGATFDAALTNASLSLVGGTGCGAGAAVIQAGGAAAGSSVTFLVDTNNGCTVAPTGFSLALAQRKIANNDTSIAVTLKNGNAPTINIGNTPISRTFVSSVNGFSAFVNSTVDSAASDGADNADVDTFALLGSGATPYLTLSGDNKLAAAGVAATTFSAGNPAYVSLSGNAAQLTSANLPAYNLSVGNTIAGLTPGYTTNDLATATGITSLATPATGLTVAQNITGTPVGGTTAIAGGAFSVTVTPLATGSLLVADTPITANTETVELEGTNLLAPWFSGSQAQSQSQVRLSNTGTTASVVRVQIINGLFNFNGTPTTFADATCATTFSLPADGDLVLTSAAINTCFGAFLRGDLLITVQAAPTNITAKMRNTSSTGTFETTLGRASGAGVAAAAQ